MTLAMRVCIVDSSRTTFFLNPLAFPAMNNAFRITSASAEPVKIPLGLGSLQKEVGGLIEAAFTIPSVDGGSRYVTGYVNEEGMLLKLPVCLVTSNEGAFSGPCIIVGLDYSTGETIPLSETEMAWVASSCGKIMEMTPPGMDTMRVWGLDLASEDDA